MRSLDLFADLSEEDLTRLYELTRTIRVPAGTRLIEEGDAGDEMYIVLDGELEVSKRNPSGEETLGTRHAGQFVGEMALLEDSTRTATVVALQDSDLLVVSQKALKTLLSCSPSAPLTILKTVASRLRHTESVLMRTEKLAGLGRMAAGLAHDLNNPGAAARRATEQLRGDLVDLESATLSLSALELSESQKAVLDQLRARLADHDAEGSHDPVTAAEAEGEIEGWLGEQGVEGPWEIAAVFAACGWTRAELEGLSDSFDPNTFPAIVRWLASGAAVHQSLGVIRASTDTIASIVGAVKAYSHLDQAPVQDVDIRQSLENTLVILGHRLKDGVRVVRDYAADLPRIEGYAAELGQVWTNLIDNAVDAMNGKGELLVRAFRRDDGVVVQIRDNGPGIPTDVVPHVFDPFYTTKEPGAGTGLGLHIAYQVITQKHRGRIDVTSRPGETCFQVVLPARLLKSPQ